MEKSKVGNLSDLDLSHYLHAINLKWIEAQQELSLKKIGTKSWRDVFIRQKATIQVYKTAVDEALSRGMLVFH